MLRTRVMILPVALSLVAASSCFIERGTAGLACIESADCDPGQSCQSEVCVEGEGEGEEDNLLQNPSFEDWSGSNLLTWNISGAVTTNRTTDSVADGEFALRVSGPIYGYVGQQVSASEPWPSGTRFDARGWTRHVAEDDTPPLIELRLIYTDDSDVYEYGFLPSFSMSTWTELFVSATATQDVASVEYRLVFGNGEVLQIVDFDQASVIAVPP